MTIKLIYILVFAITDLLIWLVLNRPGLFSRRLQYLLAVVFALFIILHTGAVKSELLLPWREFFSLIVFTCVPVLFYAWFTGLLARRRSRKIVDSKFTEGMINVARIIFLYVVNIAALVAQVLMILGYHSYNL